MTIEVKLTYDLTPMTSHITGAWHNEIDVRLEFQMAKRIFKPELKYTLAKSEDFKKTMSILITEALNAMLPEIMVEAANGKWNRPNPYTNQVSMNTNGGRMLYVDINLFNQPTGQPWTVQDVEKFLWR